MRLNPLAVWIDYQRQRDLAIERRAELDRIERQEDREVLRAAIVGMTQTVQAQSQVFQSFLDGFKVTEPPRPREWDDEESEKKWRERKKAQQAELPKELVGLDKLQQFELLLDKLNGD